MGKRKKLPECKCIACERFNADGVQLYIDLEGIEARYPSRASEKFLRLAKQELWPDGNCDLCGSEWSHRIAFVPQIIKDFLRVNGICYGCRSHIRDIQREHEWFICWGSTSDDEIKWFLLHLQLENFNKTVRALSPAQAEKDKAFQAWLDSLPKYEEEPVRDFQFTIRRRPEATT